MGVQDGSETKDFDREVFRESMGYDLSELTEAEPENEAHAIVMRLLEDIRGEFPDEPFTATEMEEAFNSLTMQDPASVDDWDSTAEESWDTPLEDDNYDEEEGDDKENTINAADDEENRCFNTVQVNYNSGHLNHLVKNGYLIYIEPSEEDEEGTYLLSTTAEGATEVLDFSS